MTPGRFRAKAAHSLVGEVPDADDYEMTGTLIEVDKAGSGTNSDGRHRRFRPVQRVPWPQAHSTPGSSSIFEPVPAVAANAGSGASPKSAGGAAAEAPAAETRNVDARGSISRVLMAWRASSLLPRMKAA